MKIKANSAAAFALMTGAMLVTSCANDVETDINADPTGNALNFAPAVGHSTRATETDVTNLGDFAVVARGIHHDGIAYQSYLIGDEAAGEIATRVSLASDNKSGTWKLSRNVYWPSTLEKVMFFGYTTLKNGESSTNGVLGNATFGHDVNNNPVIGGFQPLKATAFDGSGIWADGQTQKDLVIAFTETTKTINVPLQFTHALTQISIKAAQHEKLDNDNRIVKIKGAWIVNAAHKKDLTVSVGHDSNKKPVVTKSWAAPSGETLTTTTYGSFYNDPITLETDKDNKPAKDILRSSLMLIPEDLTAWDCKSSNSNNGAYILLLCRVELEHNGTTHDQDANMEDIGVNEALKKHYHQLFPENTQKYNANEYGFACVPLSSTWATDGMGKHYTYILNICGNGAGAGKYPPMSASELSALIPTDATNTTAVTTIPSGKNVGDNVLDEPIQFSVTVSDWSTETDSSWTDGTKVGKI